MPLRKHNIYQRILALVFTILSISQLTSSAKLEQVMLSINDIDKKVTFTFYHFDSSKTATLTGVKVNIGDNVTSSQSTAAVSASAITNLTYQSGKFVFTKTTPIFIKNKSLTGAPKSTGIHKHTLILTDEKNQHAILYTPNVSEKELGYALKNYLSTSKTKYSTALIINTGNQCGFYKKNGQYNPYYLKELKKPTKALVIK